MMDKFLHSRFFRFLVCFVLVCAILINCSPVRAQATEIGIGVTGIGVLFWFILMFGGMPFEPTQDVLNDLDRAGQAYIDDWIVQAADDAAAASAELKESIQEVNQYFDNPDDYLDEDPLDDPRDYGFNIDKWGNIVIGGFLGTALADWFEHIITDGGVEIEEELTAPDGYAYYSDALMPMIPEYDTGTYPYAFIYQPDRYTWRRFVASSSPLVDYYFDDLPCTFFYCESYKNSGTGMYDSWSQSYYYTDEVGGYSFKGANILWSNYDVADSSGSTVLSGSEPSSSSNKTETVTPSTYIGEIPSQVESGTYDPDRISFPAFDFSRVISNQESALQEMRNLYEQIRDNQMSYEDFVQQIQGLPSPGIDNPSPNPSEPGETTPDETTPDEEEETDLGKFTLDLSDYFPFCIPFDLYDFFTCLNADPVAPVIDWQIPLPGGGFYPMQIDLSAYDDVAQLFRRLQLLLFCVGLAFKTRDLIKG